MLTWTTKEGAWFGNGFRIEKVSSREWLIFDKVGGSEAEAVYAEPAPLARMPTLSSAKYKAEQLHEVRETSTQRRRLAVVLGSLVSMILLFPEYPFAALLIAGVAGAAGLELLMTWIDPKVGSVREFVQ